MVTFLLVFSVLVNVWSAFASQNCPQNAHFFYIKSSEILDSLTQKGFEASILKGLQAPLSELGYCPKLIDNWSQWKPDTSLDAQKVLKIHPKLSGIQFDSAGNQQVLLIAGLVNDKTITPKKVEASFERPMFSLPYIKEESEDILRIVVQKIVENLRDRFTCHLMVKSSPSEIRFYTKRGLKGITPSEWVLPVGRDIQLHVKEKGYFRYSAKIPLRSPGEHHHFIILKQRRFYHSKMMIPTILFALMSGVSYYNHSIYYTQYQDLGKDDLERDPDIFKKKFRKAKDWERITIGCVIASVSSFIFTFQF